MDQTHTKSRPIAIPDQDKELFILKLLLGLELSNLKLQLPYPNILNVTIQD